MFSSFWIYLLEALVGKSADKIADELQPHIEPEESDWDWSKSEDAAPDTKTAIVVVRDIDLSLFLGEISQLIEKGFDTVQISVALKKFGQLEVYQKYLLNYTVRAFHKGTQLQLAAERIDGDHLGIAISCDSVLATKIAKFIPKYDQGNAKAESD